MFITLPQVLGKNLNALPMLLEVNKNSNFISEMFQRSLAYLQITPVKHDVTTSVPSKILTTAKMPKEKF